MSRPANRGLPDMAPATVLREKAFYNTVWEKRSATLRLVAATSDLFMRSRITELARQTGTDAFFASGSDELRRLVAQNRAELVILDLESTDYDPFAIARELKTNFNARLFGVFPHVKTELKKRANEAGFEYVVPNSDFLNSLRRVILEGSEED